MLPIGLMVFANFQTASEAFSLDQNQRKWNKMLIDGIKNMSYAKLSVMCRHRTGSCLEQGAFYMLK